MRKVAPEMDQLMWTLVEAGNDRAIQEFAYRHPEHRTELMRRVTMVSSLRRANPELSAPASPPPFRPRQAPAPAPTSRWMVAAVATALAGLAVASYYAGSQLFPKATPVPTVVETPKGTPSNVDRFEEDESKPKDPVASVAETPPSSPVRDEPPIEPPRVSSRPISLRISQAPLITVLEAIAAQSGMKVIPAPGMVNPDVNVNYENRPAMEVLEDLGRQHHFTAFDQGDGSIIVIPAVQQDLNRGRLGG